MSIELKFHQQRSGWGCEVGRLAVGKGGVGHRGVAPVGRADRGLRRRRRAGATRACTAGPCPSGRSAAEDGVGRLFCFALQRRQDLRALARGMS
jgi:hypothetical protein